MTYDTAPRSRMTSESAHNHIRIVSFLTLGTGLLALIPALFVILAAFGVAAAGTFGGEPGGGILAGGIVSVIGFFMALMALPAIAAGFGLLARKSWARVLTLILAAIGIFAFPIGTLLAAYQFWVLAINEETTAAYRAASRGEYA